LRSAPHTDFGSITLLLTEDKPGGLQVLDQNERWCDVQPLPGAYIVNLGDLMAQWTNDRWRSTVHRVVNPPHEPGLDSRRQSIVFFHQPNYDAVVECIPTCRDAAHPARYAPVRSGEHLHHKLTLTLGDTTDG
jgi:isopenicillin N synthase-like dioxygenase